MADQPTSFTLFPKLPNEVQFSIWSYVCNEHQILEVECVRKGNDPKIVINFTWTSNLVPPILHVSKCARRVGLKYYTLVKIDGYHPFYTNFNTSLLYFKGSKPAVDLKDFQHQTDVTPIQNVALRRGSWSVKSAGKNMLEELRKYPSLKYITFFLHSPYVKGHITSLRTATASELDDAKEPAAITKVFQEVAEGKYYNQWLGLHKGEKEYWSGWNVPTVNFKVPEHTIPYNCPKYPYPSRACEGNGEKREYGAMLRRLRQSKAKTCCFSCKTPFGKTDYRR